MKQLKTLRFNIRYVWGTFLLGKVDKTPEGYLIATSFFHIFFIPVIPLSSYIITVPGLMKWTGIPIKWQKKSIIIGYLRSFCLFTILLFCIGAYYIFEYYGNPSVREEAMLIAYAAVIIGLLGLIILFLSFVLRWISKANSQKSSWIKENVNIATKETPNNKGFTKVKTD